MNNQFHNGKEKNYRIAIEKYRIPISEAAFKLSNTIDKLLNNPSITNDINLKFSILYDFGCLFGWIEILLNETYLEKISTPLKPKRKTFKYLYNLDQFLKNITKDYYSNYFPIRDYNLDLLSEMVNSLGIHLPIIHTIGQLMIDYKTTNSNLSKVINMKEFIRNYEESKDFQKWFVYIENLFYDVRKSNWNPQCNVPCNNLCSSYVVYPKLFDKKYLNTV